MAGQISELARRTLRKDFRSHRHRARPASCWSTRSTSVLGDVRHQAVRRRRQAARAARRRGLARREGRRRRRPRPHRRGHERATAPASPPAPSSGPPACRRSSLANTLAEQTGAEMDRGGRIKVQPDCTLPGHPEVFVDRRHDVAERLPRRRAGRDAAGQVRRRRRSSAGSRGKAAKEPFHYFDKGSMATISRFNAVANVGPLRFGGFIAWVLWLAIHVLYLVGLQEPGDDGAALGGQLHRPRPRAAHDHPPAARRPRRAARTRRAAPRRAAGDGSEPAAEHHRAAECPAGDERAADRPAGQLTCGRGQ